MQECLRPKLMRRKAAQSVVSQPCEKCAAQVNLNLVSTTPKKLWRGTCETCGQKAKMTDGLPNERKVIGYLRVSTQDQGLEKNKADILVFACKLWPKIRSRCTLSTPAFSILVLTVFCSRYQSERP